MGKSAKQFELFARDMRDLLRPTKTRDAWGEEILIVYKDQPMTMWQ